MCRIKVSSELRVDDEKLCPGIHYINNTFHWQHTLCVCLCVCVCLTGPERDAHAMAAMAGDELWGGVSCSKGKPNGYTLLVVPWHTFYNTRAPASDTRRSPTRLQIKIWLQCERVRLYISECRFRNIFTVSHEQDQHLCLFLPEDC